MKCVTDSVSSLFNAQSNMTMIIKIVNNIQSMEICDIESTRMFIKESTSLTCNDKLLNNLRSLRIDYGNEEISDYFISSSLTNKLVHLREMRLFGLLLTNRDVYNALCKCIGSCTQLRVFHASHIKFTGAYILYLCARLCLCMCMCMCMCLCVQLMVILVECWAGSQRSAKR